MVLRRRRVQSCHAAYRGMGRAPRAVASCLVVASLTTIATLWSPPAQATASTAVVDSSAQRDAFCGALRAQQQQDADLTNAASRNQAWRELRSLTVDFLRHSRRNYATMAAQSTGRLRGDLQAVIEYSRQLQKDVASSQSREEFARALDREFVDKAATTAARERVESFASRECG